MKSKAVTGYSLDCGRMTSTNTEEKTQEGHVISIVRFSQVKTIFPLMTAV